MQKKKPPQGSLASNGIHWRFIVIQVIYGFGRQILNPKALTKHQLLVQLFDNLAFLSLETINEGTNHTKSNLKGYKVQLALGLFMLFKKNKHWGTNT